MKPKDIFGLMGFALGYAEDVRVKGVRIGDIEDPLAAYEAFITLPMKRQWGYVCVAYDHYYGKKK